MINRVLLHNEHCFLIQKQKLQCPTCRESELLFPLDTKKISNEYSSTEDGKKLIEDLKREEDEEKNNLRNQNGSLREIPLPILRAIAQANMAMQCEQCCRQGFYARCDNCPQYGNHPDFGNMMMEFSFVIPLPLLPPLEMENEEEKEEENSEEKENINNEEKEEDKEEEKEEKENINNEEIEDEIEDETEEDSSMTEVSDENEIEEDSMAYFDD
jgi:hypothetical protein